MKTAVLKITLAILSFALTQTWSNPTQAAPQITASQRLICSSGVEHESLLATLDFSSFDPKSQLFQVTDAQLRDNFATANLHCAGHRLHEIVCVGFMFDTPTSIVKVTVQRVGNQHVADYEVLDHDQFPKHNTPWPCRVEAQ